MTAKKIPANKKSTPVLKRGESQRKNGTFDFRWTDTEGRRHTLYAATLDELRAKEQQVAQGVPRKRGVFFDARFHSV